MRHSDMIGTGAYASGRPFVSVWTMVEGYPDCVMPALPLASTDAHTVAATIAVNRAIAMIAARAEQVEAAAVLAAQEPPPETVMVWDAEAETAIEAANPAWVAWDAARQMLMEAETDADLQHLLRSRRKDLIRHPWGFPAEEPWCLSLPPVPAMDPLTQTATWDGAAWNVRQLSVDEAASWPLRPPPVPPIVSRTQLRLVLAELPAPPESEAGTMLDFVDATVAAAGDRVLQERWAAERMERDSPYLIGMATGLLGLDSEGIDAIFRQAGEK